MTNTDLLLPCLLKQSANKALLRQYSATDWEETLAAAELHGVGPILYHTIKDINNLDIPENVWEEMRRQYFASAARNMRLYHELQKILHLFHNKNIPLIVLKGAHLSEKVYGNIALRGMGDVDLLVKKEDLPSVEQELLELGSVPRDLNRLMHDHAAHFSYKLPQSGLIVEIHWTLVQTIYPCRIDLDGIWRRAQPMKLQQTPALVLSPEDLLLYLCVHSAKHTHDMHLRMLYDISEVLRHYENVLDWPVICARAQQWGITRALYVFLRLTRELLRVAVPPDRLAAIKPEGFEESYLATAREQILTAGIHVPIMQAARLWETKGLFGKLALIGKRLLLSREIMASMYPAPADSWRICLYYPVRLKDVLKRHGGFLWQLVRRNPKTRTAAEKSNKATTLHNWLMSG